MSNGLYVESVRKHFGSRTILNDIISSFYVPLMVPFIFEIDLIRPLLYKKIKQLIKSHSEEKGFIITDHDYLNVLDISTSTILIKRGATKKIKDLQELIELGYLPARNN